MAEDKPLATFSGVRITDEHNPKEQAELFEMHFGRILEGIWGGEINPVGPSAQDPVCTLLRVMLPVRTIVLSCANERADSTFVLTEDCHVEPDLPLGDVLAEEFGMDVPEQSLVAILPHSVFGKSVTREDVSAVIGRVLAQFVVLVAERGLLSLDREIATVRSLADFYRSHAEDTRLAGLGLHARAFRAAFHDEMRALFGWPILPQVEAETAPPTRAQRYFKAQIEAFAGCGRTVTHDHFADLAVRFATAASDGAWDPCVEDRV